MTSVPGLGGSATLSVTDVADGGGDKAILSRSVSDILVNTAHLAKSLTAQPGTPPRSNVGQRGVRAPELSSGYPGRMFCRPVALFRSTVDGKPVTRLAGTSGTTVNRAELSGHAPLPCVNG